MGNAIISSYKDIDTPALLFDEGLAEDNIRSMQRKADELGLKLRPHIKTHRTVHFAKLQMEAGACGIACAKLGEAEVMADAGITDILIANEIIGISKYKRLRALHDRIHIRVGIDNTVQLAQMNEVFADAEKPLEVEIEYEVGENRSGINTDEQLIALVNEIKKSQHVVLKGIFSHEGHTYRSNTREDCVKEAKIAHARTVRAADIIRGMGVDIDTVSIGATPSVMNMDDFEGVTELRLGTYVFFDAGQAAAIGDFSHCAATVLTSVISKPIGNRVVTDSGAKALAAQNRTSGICATKGFGCVKGRESIKVDDLYDEHAVFNNDDICAMVDVGDKIEIIPSHICPTVNLYDKAYLVSGGKVLAELPIDCRGKSQ